MNARPRKIVLAALLLGAGLCAPAAAREGFSVNIGFGGGFWDVNKNSMHAALADISRPNDDTLTNTMHDGLAIRFAMSYNILGFVSIDLGATGSGWHLGRSDLGGGGYAFGGVSVWPLEAWLPDRQFDFFVSVAGGFSMIGGGNRDDDFDRGMRGGLAEIGLGGKFYVTRWFSIGADFRVGVPFYDTWIVDWGDKEAYDLNFKPDVFLMSLTFVTAFHFGAPS